MVCSPPSPISANLEGVSLGFRRSCERERVEFFVKLAPMGCDAEGRRQGTRGLGARRRPDRRRHRRTGRRGVPRVAPTEGTLLARR